MSIFNGYSIIIPSNQDGPIICDFLQQTIEILAQKNKVIVINSNWHEPLTSFADKINTNKQLNPREVGYFKFIPFTRYSAIKKLNILLTFLWIVFFLKRSFKKKKILLWNFFPDFFYIPPFARKLGVISLFDLIDYFSSGDLEKAKLTKKKIVYSLNYSDLAFANSTVLKNKFQTQINKKIHVVPQGFRTPINFESKEKQFLPKIPVGKKIAGFVGAINNRIDYKLMYSVAKNKTNWHFLFIGPVEFDDNVSTATNEYQSKLSKLDNCTFTGYVDKKNIQGLVEKFDVSLIPYSSSFLFNKYSFPMKTMEYFYAQKPVIATQICELKNYFPYVYCSDNFEQWIQFLSLMEQNAWPEKVKKEQKRIAVNNSWIKKISAIYLIYTWTNTVSKFK